MVVDYKKREKRIKKVRGAAKSRIQKLAKLTLNTNQNIAKIAGKQARVLTKLHKLTGNPKNLKKFVRVRGKLKKYIEKTNIELKRNNRKIEKLKNNFRNLERGINIKARNLKSDNLKNIEKNIHTGIIGRVSSTAKGWKLNTRVITKLLGSVGNSEKSILTQMKKINENIEKRKLYGKPIVQKAVKESNTYLKKLVNKI